MVVTVNKELDVLDQGLQPSSNAPRLAYQLFEVMSQVSVDSFHRKSSMLIRTHPHMGAITQGVVDWKDIRIIVFGVGSTFQACKSCVVLSNITTQLKTQRVSRSTIDVVFHVHTNGEQARFGRIPLVFGSGVFTVPHSRHEYFGCLSRSSHFILVFFPRVILWTFFILAFHIIATLGTLNYIKLYILDLITL